MENIHFDCSDMLCFDCPLKDSCDTYNREEEADSFPVGYSGGDLEEWQRQVDGARADFLFP